MAFDLPLLAFVTASIAIIVVPGVDFALVTRQVVRYGRRAGFATLSGLVVGGLVHAALATAGLSALLVSSPRLYAVLRVAGALYLVYLGGLMLWATRKPAAASPAATTPESTTDDALFTDAAPDAEVAGARTGGGGVAVQERVEPRVNRRALGLGIASNLLNPKVVLFYVTFVPQFVTPGPGAAARTAFLAGTFITLAVAWWILYILTIDRLQAWLSRPTVRTTIERLTALTLLAFGVALALGH